MTIQILPARLANQIAAGEVVERPASVVKELVENSIDAGATRIDIDIEKGGSRLIRVRDNGEGINKDELTLALSRHATSKIHSLDDLEGIVSLGFRGEALASISSVSRLTLTSRTVAQEQAWSAYAEGRDMTVTTKPAAHPIGTTIEVLDLFFNTPARRKFLKADKTEFTHIDELLKRIALSYFGVAITLKHNGKVIRQYRASHSQLQKEKRLALVCGSNFVDNSISVELNHDGLTLTGWISTPQGARAQSDQQYCYVNGRMMRDKLINHAIRQSYESSLSADQFSAYVLFIEIDPHQVDVNVHPAKHEVRFHQARLVHDFIYQAIASALEQAKAIDDVPKSRGGVEYQTRESVAEQVMEAVAKVPVYPRQQDRSQWNQAATTRPSNKQVKAYQHLLQTPVTMAPVQKIEGFDSLGKGLAVIESHYLLMENQQQIQLLSLRFAEYLKVLGQLNLGKTGLLKAQSLLIPHTIPLDKVLLTLIESEQQLLSQLGIQLKAKGSQAVIVMSVSQPLRQQNLQQLIPDLLSYLHRLETQNRFEKTISWLATQVLSESDCYSMAQAIQLIADIERLWEGELVQHYERLLQPVDFDVPIKAFFNNE
ncbi:MAG: DNA mismatch repair endonuclease MutL [Aliivibrio sp.]|uniref:DNA mismatch repair endonuclease MutL n=1 Tax=Aliivibrio sp. TaxID=1872443 RepID=UPI001A6069F0|nr:DNA mismatch repair endonuclease MutL [Aliivibrio sp.]